MSADGPPPGREGALPLTGERTIPGLAEENYWFRRHEVVYQRLTDRCAGRDVLEAGCGEGYGADLIADVARSVIGVDYDESAVAHVRARYPRVDMRHGNLAELPLPDGVGGCGGELPGDRASVGSATVRRRMSAGAAAVGGLLLMSTPNRVTFSPGRDTPINPFHTRELNAAELTELLVDAGFALEAMQGVFHGARLAELDAKYGGSIIDAQIARALADAPWPDDLLADVAVGRASRISTCEVGRDDRDIDASLDLVATRYAHDDGRPPGSSPSSCTPTCRGWPTTDAGRSARNGSTSPGRRHTSR